MTNSNFVWKEYWTLGIERKKDSMKDRRLCVKYYLCFPTVGFPEVSHSSVVALTRQPVHTKRNHWFLQLLCFLICWRIRTLWRLVFVVFIWHLASWIRILEYPKQWLQLQLVISILSLPHSTHTSWEITLHLTLTPHSEERAIFILDNHH